MSTKNIKRHSTIHPTITSLPRSTRQFHQTALATDARSNKRRANVVHRRRQHICQRHQRQNNREFLQDVILWDDAPTALSISALTRAGVHVIRPTKINVNRLNHWNPVLKLPASTIPGTTYNQPTSIRLYDNGVDKNRGGYLLKIAFNFFGLRPMLRSARIRGRCG